MTFNEKMDLISKTGVAELSSELEGYRKEENGELTKDDLFNMFKSADHFYTRRRNTNPDRMKDYLRTKYRIYRCEYDIQSDEILVYNWSGCFYPLHLKIQDYRKKWAFEIADFIPYIQVGR